MLEALKNTLFPNKQVKLLKALNNAVSERESIKESINEKHKMFSVLSGDINKSLEDDLFNDIFMLSKEKEIANNKVEQILDLITSDIKKAGKFKYLDKMNSSLNYSREQMPQIDSENLTDFVAHFGEKVGIKKVSKKLSQLKPTQNEINNDKLTDLYGESYREDFNPEKIRYVISNDDYLMDGHHRWAAGLEADENAKVTCYQINLPIKQLVNRASKMKIAKKKDINDNTVEKAELLINYETFEDLPLSDFYKSLIVSDYRPVGIPQDVFIEAALILSKQEGEILEKAKANLAGKIPVRRIVRRKDGTVFSQVFWESREDTQNVKPKDARPNIEKLSPKVKEMFEKQKIADKIVRKGDTVNVRFVGSIFAGKYKFDGWKVLSVKSDRIIVEVPENIHTREPKDNPVSFRKGARIEIPRANNPMWSEFQGFDVSLDKDEMARRKALLDMVLNSESINEANKEGFKICSDLVGKSQAEVAEYLENFNAKWPGFDPISMFKSMKPKILEALGEGSRADFKFNVTRHGSFEFKIFGHDSSGKQMLYMNRTSDDGRHNPGGMYTGKKGVYHNYFSLKPEIQGKGIAKTLFKDLYEQYKNTGADYLAVHANIDVGGYTWGSMGFRTNNLREADDLCRYFSSRKGMQQRIRRVLVKKDDVDLNEKIVKVDSRDEHKRLSNEFEHYTAEYLGAEDAIEAHNEGADVLDDKTLEEVRADIVKYRDKIAELQVAIDKLPKQKRYTEHEDGYVIDEKESEYYTITQKDVDKAELVLATWKKENPGETRFPVSLLCKIGNKKAGQAAFLGTSWHGTINLGDKGEREAFERYLGYETPVVTMKEKNLTTKKEK